ncbi:hypothetical protein CEXT_339351 [Caerostris extrusa]|uniref:Uncharacterized protein n=1 Tax=Caerostris extrusa TaxID=172846 RepID=A0AAV4TPM4_CAEEX|nr:hypothetical protein CEXT_339351 [Caerostris extrusa]
MRARFCPSGRGPGRSVACDVRGRRIAVLYAPRPDACITSHLIVWGAEGAERATIHSKPAILVCRDATSSGRDFLFRLQQCTEGRKIFTTLSLHFLSPSPIGRSRRALTCRNACLVKRRECPTCESGLPSSRNFLCQGLPEIPGRRKLIF